MGRSKFPGKPSKHVNRTRINVLSTVVNTTVVGDSNTDTDTNTNINVVTVTEGDNSKKTESEPSQPTGSKNRRQNEAPRSARKKRVSVRIKRSLLLSSSTPVRLTRSKDARRSMRGFRKLAKPKLSPKKEAGNLVGKFVLPSRSVHSSRVIKPNKRFITVEQNEARIIKKRVKKQCEKVQEKAKVVEATAASPVTSNSNGKVVLRQARLQVGLKSEVFEGPFTSNLMVVSNTPGTITCGVCSAVRFYRFIKQARKFNIYSCELCRKFISKLIQHSNTKKTPTPLNCLKGQGVCHVPPMVRNQQWKLNRISNNSRCSACWLKLCLRSFQIPMALKTSLTQLLPRNMQTNDNLFSNSLPLLTWQSATNDKKSPRPEPPKTPPPRQRPVRLKPPRKEDKPLNPPIINEIKRQKIDLKGPRVKHVCRSASIVLGQPAAIFTPEKKVSVAEEKEKTVPEIPVVKNIELELEKKSSSDIVVDIKLPEVIQIPEEEPKVTKEAPVVVNKKEKVKSSSILPLEIAKPTFNKKSKKISPQLENANTIDTDFWEAYDPDEVVCNGFSIVASEVLPMHSICFLCGSAGKDILLYCCICCEPYHPFCLEQGPPSFNTPEHKYTWTCPKCTTCSACGEADRQKINCQKCHKAYHPQCFNTKWRTDDRPTVCSNCLRCKSCGTDNITKFVGNLALCLICFKLRNKGNFCPICQRCYDDNDFDTKMMECGKCNKWVHAKCEGLSDEHYQILSILPESVEFLCCLCSNQSTPFWRKAVQTELRSCFNNILRLLSKNRIARDMLKLSPFRTFSPVTKNLSSARRLQFIDNDTPSTDTDNTIDNELEQVNAIFKNKIDFGDSFTSTSLNDSKTPMSPSMVEIRNKLSCNKYFSLQEFNEGMENALKSTNSDELLNIYRRIVKNVFPWFDPAAKEDLDKSVSEVIRTEKPDEEKKCSFEVFDVYSTNKIDNRVCSLCKGIGDGLAEKEARLLYCGQNDWVHANCALWSSEVYEEIDGSLQNVHSAITRGRSIRCALCKQKGASVGCCLKGCYETYHFPCAQKGQCIFIVDRTIYCNTHKILDLNVLTNPRDFEIRRSVYIELDGKKKKLCEPEKVNYMVGSLSVVSLGKIIPSISDNVDAIIPVGFVCSRLFWSTTEPWKLIPYKITTAILNSQSQIYVDKNFTVDHTLPKNIVEKKLRDIILWQRDDKEKHDLVDFDDDEEPQSTGDILSPELTDAILNDLLDGISVQEMLMGYDEWMNIDPEINCNDNLSLNMNNDAKIEDCEDAKNPNPKETKRSKSEVFQKLEDKLKPRGQQRSCSLTWLQLDNTLSPAIKKRKIAPPRDNNVFLQILQVDGACDSSSSECGSPTHETESIWSTEPGEEPVSCEKCQCTYRTSASYKRHLESCDAMFTSESEPETDSSGATVINVSINETPGLSPVLSSFESYSSSIQTTQNQIQSTVLNTQAYVTEQTKVQENNGVFYNYQPVKTVIPAQPNIININQPITVNQNSDNSNTPLLNQFCVNQQNVCVNQNVALSQQNLVFDKNSIALNSPIISVDNSQVINQINPINGVVEPMTIHQSVPFGSEVSPIISIAPQNQAITMDAKMIATPTVVNIPQSQWVRPILPQSKTRQRPRIIAKRPKIPAGSILLQQSSPSVILQHIPSTNMIPFMDAFQQQSSQNVQYVTTITPQLNSTIAPQTQLVQLPENNFISIVPNVQPTMIIQQPRVDTGQLIVDSSGSMMWAPAPQPLPQVQPVYYGFETIVQNTVMQSQQFLPTTMPGVLTTNSSYSATTQVFQTGKLEPVIDGSFVLVNSNQLINQPATVQVPQIQPNITQNQNISVQPQSVQSNIPPAQAKPVTCTPTVTLATTQIKPAQVLASTAPNNNTSNSITLPIAPFVPEQGIPTNIVTPTPKPPATTQPRPMSRVLPMQTTVLQQKKSEKPVVINEIKIESVVDKPVVEEIVSIKKSPTCPPKEITNAEVRPVVDVLKEIVQEIKEPVVVVAKVEKVEEVEAIKEIIEKELTKEPEIKIPKIPIVPLKPIKPKPSQANIAEKENTITPAHDIKAQLETAEEPFKQLPKTQKRSSHPSIFYKIESSDGFDFTSPSLSQIWRKVFQEVQAARQAHNLPPLPDTALKAINDIDLLGVKTKGLKYLLEQLPEAIKCKTYKPVFHKPQNSFKIEEDEDDEGCRRCTPFDMRREKYDMFGWLSSKHRTLEMYDLDAILKKNASSSLPMAMRFRTLKIISKYSVGVYRSEIHGRGLFSLRDIEAGEMVIEYAGEVIRSILTDKREKYYNSKGIGCYMFRIDDNLVVDATMKGNAARFINHSCDPNCYSKVVEILGCKHIIIFALRRIICGEELTYDYKFPFEEDKIPCTCGTRRCRKFLN